MAAQSPRPSDKEMSSSLYSVLGVDSSATAGEIREAYKKNALLHHPDKNLERKEAAESEFKKITEAARILGDPDTRKAYDEQGISGISDAATTQLNAQQFKRAQHMFWNLFADEVCDLKKELFSSPTPTCSSESYEKGSFPPQGSEPSTLLGKRTAPEPPTTGSSTANPILDQHSRRMPSTTTSSSGISSKFPSSASFSSSGSSACDPGSPCGLPKGTPDDPAGAATTTPSTIHRRLDLSLEEMFFGCKKRLRLTRNVLSPGAATVNRNTDVTLLDLEFPPGTKPGTTFCFDDRGKMLSVGSTQPKALALTVQEKPHPRFQRKGADLITSINISLWQALLGFDVDIQGIDGLPVNISAGEDHVISPETIMNIPSQGMRIDDRDDTRGDLQVKFNIEFPTTLSHEQRSKIRDALKYQ